MRTDPVASSQASREKSSLSIRDANSWNRGTNHSACEELADMPESNSFEMHFNVPKIPGPPVVIPINLQDKVPIGSDPVGDKT